MGETQIKKQMSIALVGVRPADQVTLKGYLRVLLSLDVDLQWVAATAPTVDLFMINHEFRHAESVVKLLESKKKSAVLYIDRTELDEGKLSQNQLTLPLKQISELHAWLLRYVPILSSETNPPSSTAPDTTTSATTTPLTATPTTTNSTPAIDTTPKPNELIEIIKQCQARTNLAFELINEDRVIAIIDTQSQRVWLQNGMPALTPNLHLEPFTEALPDKMTALDLNDWLWQLAMADIKLLMPLLDFSYKYQLRYWAKPSVGSFRREALSVMTVMEKAPLAIAEIAGKSGVSLANTQKIVAGLLFSGNLMPDVYDKLEAMRVNTQPTISQTLPAAETVSEPKPAAEQEKLGFLSRLRKKLGI